MSWQCSWWGDSSPRGPCLLSFALRSVNEAHAPESQQISMWTGLGRTCTAVTTIVAVSILSSTASLPTKPFRKKTLSRGLWKRESPIFTICVTILCLKVIIPSLKTTFFLLLYGTYSTARRRLHCEVQWFNTEYKHNRDRWWRKVEPLLSLFVSLPSMKSSLCQTGGIICFLFLEEAALYSREFWDPKLLHKSCRKGLVYFPS